MILTSLGLNENVSTRDDFTRDNFQSHAAYDIVPAKLDGVFI